MFSEKEFLQAIADNQLIIYKVCNLYMDTKRDRQDLMQEILLNAWKGVKNYKGEAKFSTWLYRVALNTAITFFKKDQKHAGVFLEQPDDQQLVADPPPDSEQLDAMKKAIFHLSNIDKAIVTLYLDDFDYRQIGDMMGISVNHVAVKMNRIKNKLRETGKKYL